MSLLFSMVVFSLFMSISPGPVNFVALTSGVNYGFVKSFKFVSGATVGFVALLLLVGIGVGKASQSFPVLLKGLQYIGCIYIVYIGYKVFTDDGKVKGENKLALLPSFSQGWLMQWVNPKAWIACLAGCSAFDVYNSDLRLVQFITIYFIVCYIAIAGWAFLGNKINRWLSTEHTMRFFNKTMGIILCGLGVGLLFN